MIKNVRSSIDSTSEMPIKPGKKTSPEITDNQMQQFRQVMENDLLKPDRRTVQNILDAIYQNGKTLN